MGAGSMRMPPLSFSPLSLPPPRTPDGVHLRNKTAPAAE